MNYKENCTKGPVLVSGGRFEVRTEKDGELLLTANHHLMRKSRQEREANTSLAAEAFNVLHETGMTPRELVAQIKAIVDEIEEYGFIGVEGVSEDHENHFTGSPSFQDAKNILNYQPVTA